MEGITEHTCKIAILRKELETESYVLNLNPYQLVLKETESTIYVIKNDFGIITDRKGILNKKYKPGYHLVPIPKGTLGDISKIEEELAELKDAESQNSVIMQLIELSDLYGAIEEFAIKLGTTMDELKKMSDITKRAFENGRRS